MNEGNSDVNDLDSPNHLLRKIAQLKLAEEQENTESGNKTSMKGIDLFREYIVRETIKSHPLATREKILKDMDSMGF